MAKIAARQHGLIAIAQLHALGMGKNGITRRVKCGRLHRIHRGIYAVGHLGLSWHGRWMAAVLACGEGTVLSHGSAASLWGLLKPIDGPLHVSVPSTSGRSTRRGIHIHRAPSLAGPATLTAYRHNIPVTTVSRTIEARPLLSRLPLASTAPHRRGRHLHLPPRLGRFRGRPPARSRAAPAGLCGPSLHRRTARSRTGARRRGYPGGAVVESPPCPTPPPRPSSS